MHKIYCFSSLLEYIKMNGYIPAYDQGYKIGGG